MRAIVQERYGLEATRLEVVDKPVPAEDEVLVRVRAASVNALDYYSATGRPLVGRAMMGLRRPKAGRLGADFAGVVEAVGRDVRDLAPGDEVYGMRDGAFAEYVAAKKAVGRKPANTSVAEAAAVPVAGLTALQALRDHACIREGMRVIVNGASGGVGTFAIQIAKALGAHVTAVCSSQNVEQARALGADAVIDYTRADFTRSGERYDVIFDNAGNRSWKAMRRVLAEGGVVVLVGGPRSKRLFGPLGHVARVKAASLFGGGRAVFFVAKPNNDDLATLRELIESGRVRPVLQRTVPLEQVADALALMRDGHARAKVAIAIDDDATVSAASGRS